VAEPQSGSAGERPRKAIPKGFISGDRNPVTCKPRKAAESAHPTRDTPRLAQGSA